MRHLRKAKMCSQGARTFAKKHNLDWSEFLKKGIDSSRLSHIEDAMVKQILEMENE